MKLPSNSQTLDQFLEHIFKAEYEQAFQRCNANVEFIIFRTDIDRNFPIHGTHTGKLAGIELFKSLAELFEFGDFKVEDSVVDDSYVIKFGSLAHTVKQTGNVFHSLWAMIVRFDAAGKICLYRMHEDTAALEAAMQ
jgi:ketosteroid isomerase-like protein